MKKMLVFAAIAVAAISSVALAGTVTLRETLVTTAYVPPSTAPTAADDGIPLNVNGRVVSKIRVSARVDAGAGAGVIEKSYAKYDCYVYVVGLGWQKSTSCIMEADGGSDSLGISVTTTNQVYMGQGRIKFVPSAMISDAGVVYLQTEGYYE